MVFLVLTLMTIWAIWAFTPFVSWFKYTFLGYTKVRFFNGEYAFLKPFVTTVKFDEKGNIVSNVYRYENTGIGYVNMRYDGTAWYCGQYMWEIVK